MNNNLAGIRKRFLQLHPTNQTSGGGNRRRQQRTGAAYGEDSARPARSA